MRRYLGKEKEAHKKRMGAKRKARLVKYRRKGNGGRKWYVRAGVMGEVMKRVGN